jgi:hypothetical protein
MRRAQECMVVLHIDVDWLEQNTGMVVSGNPLLFAQRMQCYSGLKHNDYTEHKCGVSRTVLYERECTAYNTSTLNELTTGLWVPTGESIKGEI